MFTFYRNGHKSTVFVIDNEGNVREEKVVKGIVVSTGFSGVKGFSLQIDEKLEERVRYILV